jgi:hypothetical protein
MAGANRLGSIKFLLWQMNFKLENTKKGKVLILQRDLLSRKNDHVKGHRIQRDDKKHKDK